MQNEALVKCFRDEFESQSRYNSNLGDFSKIIDLALKVDPAYCDVLKLIASEGPLTLKRIGVRDPVLSLESLGLVHECFSFGQGNNYVVSPIGYFIATAYKRYHEYVKIAAVAEKMRENIYFILGVDKNTLNEKEIVEIESAVDLTIKVMNWGKYLMDRVFRFGPLPIRDVTSNWDVDSEPQFLRDNGLITVIYIRDSEMVAATPKAQMVTRLINYIEENCKC